MPELNSKASEGLSSAVKFLYKSVATLLSRNATKQHTADRRFPICLHSSLSRRVADAVFKVAQLA